MKFNRKHALVGTGTVALLLAGLLTVAWAYDTFMGTPTGTYIWQRSAVHYLGRDNVAFNSFVMSDGDGTATTVTKADLATIANNSDLTAGRVPIITTGGALTDDAGFLFTAATNLLTLGQVVASGSGKIDLLGLTSGTIRLTVDDAAGTGTWKLPTLGGSTDSVVGLAAAQTITNKTLNSPVINGATGTGGTFTGAVQVTGTIPMGYAVGAGNTVTQLTDKNTGVEVTDLSGQITTAASELATLATAEFEVTATGLITATDAVVVSLASGGSARSYLVGSTGVGTGTFKIAIFNTTGGPLSEALVINYAIVKGAAT